MSSALRFPTALHREVAELAGDFFSSQAYVDTILVVNSCARGRAVAGSDLDMAVLLTPTAPNQEVQSLTLKWEQFRATQPCGTRAAARLGSTLRRATVSPMPRPWVRRERIFDSFGRSGCPTLRSSSD